MSTFNWFRKIALIEGISFLMLLFIAMPMKYFGNLPKAVTIVGALHGVLFVAFVILAISVKEKYKMNFKWLALSFIASVLPFGTLIMEKSWKKEQIERTGADK